MANFTWTQNYRLFHVINKYFFNPHDNLKLPTFLHDKQKGSVCVNFTLFFHNIMTFFQIINVAITLVGHIFVIQLKWLLNFTKNYHFLYYKEKLEAQGRHVDLLSTTWKNQKFRNTTWNFNFFIIYNHRFSLDFRLKIDTSKYITYMTSQIAIDKEFSMPAYIIFNAWLQHS